MDKFTLYPLPFQSISLDMHIFDYITSIYLSPFFRFSLNFSFIFLFFFSSLGAPRLIFYDVLYRTQIKCSLKLGMMITKIGIILGNGMEGWGEEVWPYYLIFLWTKLLFGVFASFRHKFNGFPPPKVTISLSQKKHRYFQIEELAS